MVGGQEMEAPPSATWGTAEGGRGRKSQVSTQRHSDGADGARPKHGAIVRHKYGLLFTEESVGDPAAAGAQGSGDGPEESKVTGGIDGTDTGTGERNRQCTPLVHGQTFGIGERTLQTAAHAEHMKPTGGGTPNPSAHDSCEQPGDGGGHLDPSSGTPRAQPRDGGGGGNP